jgi:excisionase family DNA binding protein
MEKNTDALCVTVDDLCDLLRVSRPTAYSLVHRDGFPVIRVGRRFLIPRAGLERWLEEQTEATA